jgi:hypothetical protein
VINLKELTFQVDVSSDEYVLSQLPDTNAVEVVEFKTFTVYTYRLVGTDVEVVTKSSDTVEGLNALKRAIYKKLNDE